MFFNIILVFCIIHNAKPIPYKQNKENQLKQLNRYDIGVNHNKIYAKTLIEDDSEDLSSESRRLFDWIKKILNKNDTTVSTQKPPSYEEVMNERLRFRQIEKNLTEVLTNLSKVLTQILNIVKYSRYSQFEDIREFLPTKPERKEVYRRGNRFKRGFKETDTVPTKLNVSEDQDVTEKAKIKYISYNENQIKVNLIKSDDIVHTRNENRTKTYPKNNSSAVQILDQGNRMKRDLKNQFTKLNTENGTLNDTKVGNNLLNTLENKTDTSSLNLNDNKKPKMDVNANTQANLTKSDIEVYVPAKIGTSSLNIQETRYKRYTKDFKTEVSKHFDVDKKVEIKNTNISAKIEVINNVTDAEIDQNGRRATLSKKVSLKDEVRTRLFKYIDEAFADIYEKVNSLKHTKQMLANDASYQIGYIVSNIDTLEVNMRNMKLDMDKNKYIWDNKNILNLYDTVKVSDRAITDLLEVLKSLNVESSLNN